MVEHFKHKKISSDHRNFDSNRYAHYKDRNNWSSDFDAKLRKIIYEEIIKRQIRN